MPKEGWTDTFEKGSKNVVKGALTLGVGVPLAILATAAIGVPVAEPFIDPIFGAREAMGATI